MRANRHTGSRDAADSSNMDWKNRIASKFKQRHFEIVMGLEIHPELWAIAKAKIEPEHGCLP